MVGLAIRVRSPLAQQGVSLILQLVINTQPSRLYASSTSVQGSQGRTAELVIFLLLGIFSTRKISLGLYTYKQFSSPLVLKTIFCR